MTTHTLRTIRQQLKTGDACITGLVSKGQAWPDEPHAYAIDTTDGRTYHVLVSDRPTWMRYLDVR